MSDNLKLWESVEKTDPSYTKKANVKGNQITSIAPQFQIKNATDKFGVYGITWGFKNMEIDYTLKDIGMVSFKALFYFPNGEFEIINSIGLYRDGAMTKIDNDFAKKLETDTLTKALSKLGFNADIFLGKFDDLRYVEEVTQEFANFKQYKTASKQTLEDTKEYYSEFYTICKSLSVETREFLENWSQLEYDENGKAVDQMKFKNLLKQYLSDKDQLAEEIEGYKANR